MPAAWRVEAEPLQLRLFGTLVDSVPLLRLTALGMQSGSSRSSRLM
jgi:hypothetical protein